MHLKEIRGSWWRSSLAIREPLNELLQLLRAELQRHRQVHGRWFAVEFGGLIFPLLQGLQRRVAKQRRAGKHFHGANISVRVNQSVNLDITGYMLGLGHRRIARLNGFDELRGLHVAANRNGSGRLIAMRSAQTRERLSIVRV